MSILFQGCGLYFHLSFIARLTFLILIYLFLFLFLLCCHLALLYFYGYSFQRNDLSIYMIQERLLTS